MKLKFFILLLSVGLSALITGCESGSQNPELAIAEPNQSDNQWLKEYLEKVAAVNSAEYWNEGYGEGFLVKTEKYEIYTTINDALILRQLPLFLESLNKQYMRTSGISRVSGSRYVVYLFNTREQWELFGESFAPSDWQVYQKIEKGAFYANGACVAYNIGRVDTFSMLAHECWHQFSYRHFAYRLPAWLDEGLAMQFEGFERQRNGYVFSPDFNRARLDGLSRSFEQGQNITLQELITLNPASVIDEKTDNPSQRVNAYYSRLYAFIRFLNDYNNAVYRPKLIALIKHGLQGQWELDQEIADAARDRNAAFSSAINSRLGWEVFANYYGTRLDSMQEQFNSYCYWLTLEGGKK